MKLQLNLRKKGEEWLQCIVERTIDDEQKAGMVHFQHGLPGADGLSMEKGIGIATQQASFCVSRYQTQAHQVWWPIHFALFGGMIGGGCVPQFYGNAQKPVANGMNVLGKHC